jgi:hypothetical protein
MRQLTKRLAAWWEDPGRVRWHIPLGRGWQVSGYFNNCVSKKCLMRRVRLIIKTPMEPPRRVYRLADAALDYLVGLVSDAELDSYEVRLGVNIGAADRYDKALAEAITTRLTRKRISGGDSGGGFPELFLSMSLTYDAYDCPHGDELCEGWWLGVSAVYRLPGESCAVEWSRYVGVDKHIDVDAVLQAAYKALSHAYNASIV